jgi:hypothetical protein
MFALKISRRNVSLSIAGALCAVVSSVVFSSCSDRSKPEGNQVLDTMRPAAATAAKMPSQVDSTLAHTKPDTAHAPISDLPPIATPITPDRLGNFLPKLEGYTPGEMETETKIRKDFASSKVGRTFTKDPVKLLLEINDYAYVPFLYQPFDQYKTRYLQDDNDERTETTEISGYHAVQTWEKKGLRATIFLFPGKRFVVKLVADNIKDISAARAVLEQMDLRGLEHLQ